MTDTLVLEFKRYPDHEPEHRSNVLVRRPHTRDTYISGEVEKAWECQGEPPYGEYPYIPGQPQPENTEAVYYIHPPGQNSYEVLYEDCYWASLPDHEDN